MLKLEHDDWHPGTTISFRDLLVRIVNDPASEASCDIRLKENAAMRFYNTGVDPTSPVFVRNIVDFRRLVKDKCGVVPHNSRYSSNYAPYAGKTNKNGNLRLNLVGMRHLLQSREGNFGAAMRELCLRLEDQMRSHYDRHRAQYAELSDRVNQDREKGKKFFVAARAALMSSTGMTEASAQGVLAHLDQDTEKKLINCPPNQSIASFIENGTGIPMHTRSPGGNTKTVGQIIDHLDAEANSAMTAARALQASWIPVVAPSVTLTPVPAKTDQHGNVTKPPSTSARGAKRKLLDTQVALDGTLYNPNERVPEGVETKTLDQATATLIGLFQWGQAPMEKRLKLPEVMPHQGERVFKNGSLLAIGAGA